MSEKNPADNTDNKGKLFVTVFAFVSCPLIGTLQKPRHRDADGNSIKPPGR